MSYEFEKYEIWSTIKGIPEYYLISNYGRIKLLDREYMDKNGIIYRKKGKVEMKYHITKQGYNRITLTVNKIRKNYLLHRLVAEAFIKNDSDKCCVNHINGVRNDNRVVNLEWVTTEENELHKQLILHKNDRMGISISKKDGKYNVICRGKYIGRYKELKEAKAVYKKYYEDFKI